MRKNKKEDKKGKGGRENWREEGSWTKEWRRRK